MKQKKSWEPFKSCLLNSTANPANFHPNWAGLAVLFSRQLLTGSQDFFFVCLNFLIFIYIFRYKTIETHAPAFLPLNISAVGSVNRMHVKSKRMLIQKEFEPIDLFLSRHFSFVCYELLKDFKNVYCILK